MHTMSKSSHLPMPLQEQTPPQRGQADTGACEIGGRTQAQRLMRTLPNTALPLARNPFAVLVSDVSPVHVAVLLL